jgi:5-aminopentanamidase
LARYSSSPFNVAVAQINTKLGDVKSNLGLVRKISSQIRKSDIVCFPELATTGYSLGRKWIELAEEIPGTGTDELSEIASERGFYLICGVDERGKGEEAENIYDSAVLIDPNGKLVGVYRKVHLWGNERKYFTSGKSFPVFRTKLCTIGMGICYDLEFPESARVMAQKGAKIVFYPSAQPSNARKMVEIYVRSRSSENCIFTAFSNRIGSEGELSFFGESQVNSPNTRILAQAGRNQGFVSAKVDLKILDEQSRLLPYLRELEPGA